MKYLAIIAALVATPSAAQDVPCFPHDFITQWLAENHAESRQVLALAGTGEVLEIFASDSGSWTLTITTPGELTCIMGAGDYFQYTAEPLPPLGQEG
jgi:hypothetical protein